MKTIYTKFFTGPNLGEGKDRLNGFRKTLEAIDAGNENILYATVS
jgi:hypothetical protein